MQPIWNKGLAILKSYKFPIVSLIHMNVLGDVTSVSVLNFPVCLSLSSSSCVFPMLHPNEIRIACDMHFNLVFFLFLCFGSPVFNHWVALKSISQNHGIFFF